ncbi:MAG: type II secretion system F family protein [Thermodesulfobacteriota bacterium]
MPPFRYEAINAGGKIVSGVFTAEAIPEVEAWLVKNGLSPIAIQITAESKTDAAAGTGALTLRDRLLGVRIDDLILFCRQTATMLGAGVAILQSLKVMSQQVANPILKQAILDMIGSVESGASLSDAFARYPKIFNPLFYNVIRVGEETGTLDRSFEYLATLYENEKEVSERIKAATRYPKIVVTAIFGAVFFLMTFVVPKFVKLFASAKVALPLPTRILVAVSGFFADHFFLIVLCIAALVATYRLALNYDEFVLARDRLALKVPVFGPLATKIYMSRFCRVFSVLTTSGIDIIRTLTLAATALENRELFLMMEAIRDDVEQGVNLNDAMTKHPVVPPLVREMVAVGEQSGQLDAMLAKVADYYDAESSYTIKNLSTLIEPFLLLALAVIVGTIALAIFMPMWDMMQVMRR